MTEKEAISRIEQDLETHKKALSKEYKVALNMAIEALQCVNSSAFKDGYKKALKDIDEKKDKYRWHDLRKNPDDLPRDEERIIFYTVEFNDDDYYSEEYRYWSGIFHSRGCYFGNDDYECYVTRGGYDKEQVIAWRYIEPFEEDEE